MRKSILLALILVPVLLVTTVLSAGPPPGVGPAVRADDAGVCSVGYTDDSGAWIPIYEGSFRLHYSNGATGHMTFKCKMYRQEGQDPLTIEWEFADSPWPNCYSTISIEGGKKGMWTAQCFGYWSDSPPF